MQKENEDALWLEDARNGNMASFKLLVHKYEGKVAGVVKSMLGDTPEAEDVGQEVFIRLYEALDSFKGQSALGTYLVRIAINQSLNELKRRKRRSQLFSTLNGEAEKSTYDPTNDLSEMIRFEINQLDPNARAVVTLRMIEGYSTEDTAKVLNIPLGTVLSRLSRAQKKLREVFNKQLKS